MNGHTIVVSARRGVKSGRLIVFDAHDADEQWLNDVDARVTALPTIDGTTVYLPDWEGHIHAISTHRSVRWPRRIDGDVERAFARPVTVHEDTLFLGSNSDRTGGSRWTPRPESVDGLGRATA